MPKEDNAITISIKLPRPLKTTHLLEKSTALTNKSIDSSIKNNVQYIKNPEIKLENRERKISLSFKDIQEIFQRFNEDCIKEICDYFNIARAGSLLSSIYGSGLIYMRNYYKFDKDEYRDMIHLNAAR